MGLLCQHNRFVGLRLRHTRTQLCLGVLLALSLLQPVLWAGGTVTQVSVQLTVGWACTETSCLVFGSSDAHTQNSPVRNNEGLDADGMRQISLQMVVFGKRKWCCRIWGVQSLKKKDWFRGSFAQSLPVSWPCRFRELSEEVRPASSCCCCHTYIGWVFVPHFTVACPWGRHTWGPYFIVIANFIEALLLLANLPSRENSYFLIQKLSPDNRWLQYGPSSKPIHLWFPKSKVPQVNICYLFIKNIL